jgi:hypothetical protein
MPNVKLFVDGGLLADCGAALDAVLVPLRDLLCARLNVGPQAVHIVILPVRGLADQPPVNLELHILPRPERTQALIQDLCAAIRDMISAVTTRPTAVRCAMLDPATYVALK